MTSPEITDAEFLAEAFTEAWGERCPDYVGDCACCAAWKRFDRLSAALAAGAPGRLPESELLAERDRFIVSKGLWPEFVATLPPGAPAPSALVAEPGEPVAWEQRHRENSGEWSKWYPTSKKAFDLIGTEPDGSLQARPLYAAPPARQDGALREALEAIERVRECIRRCPNDMGFDREMGPIGCRLEPDHGGCVCMAVANALAQSAAPVQPEPAAWPDWGDRPDGFDGPTGAE